MKIIRSIILGSITLGLFIAWAEYDKRRADRRVIEADPVRYGRWVVDQSPVYTYGDPFQELTDIWMPWRKRNGGVK